MPTNDTRFLGSVEKSFRILHALRELQGARVQEVSEHLEAPPATVHKHLATLYDLGYVSKEGDEYHIGLRFLTLGGYARLRKQGYRIAINMVGRLAEESNERAQFVAEEHGRGIYLSTEANEQGVKIDRQMGMRRYLHSSAAGKAILSHLPRERIDEVIDQWGLPAETDETITDRAELESELERVRDRGVAFNDEESVPGLRAVGVPVLTPNDRVLGAFSVSGPARRLHRTRFRTELPDLIEGYANELELNLYRPD